MHYMPTYDNSTLLPFPYFQQWQSSFRWDISIPISAYLSSPPSICLWDPIQKVASAANFHLLRPLSSQTAFSLAAQASKRIIRSKKTKISLSSLMGTQNYRSLKKNDKMRNSFLCKAVNDMDKEREEAEAAAAALSAAETYDQVWIE